MVTLVLLIRRPPAAPLISVYRSLSCPERRCRGGLQAKCLPGLPGRTQYPEKQRGEDCRGQGRHFLNAQSAHQRTRTARQHRASAVLLILRIVAMRRRVHLIIGPLVQFVEVCLGSIESKPCAFGVLWNVPIFNLRRFVGPGGRIFPHDALQSGECRMASPVLRSFWRM